MKETSSRDGSIHDRVRMETSLVKRDFIPDWDRNKCSKDYHLHWITITDLKISVGRPLLNKSRSPFHNGKNVL